MKTKYYIIISILLLIIGAIIGYNWCKSNLQPITIQLPPKIITQTEYLPGKTITIIDTVWKDPIIIYKDKPIYVYSIIDTVLYNKYDFNKILTEEDGAKLSFSIQTMDSIMVAIDTLYSQSFLKYNQNIRLINFIYSPNVIKKQKISKTKKFQLYSDFNIIINEQQQIINNIIKQKTNHTPSIGLNFIFNQKYKVNLGVQNNGIMIGVGMKLWGIK